MATNARDGGREEQESERDGDRPYLLDWVYLYHHSVIFTSSLPSSLAFPFLYYLFFIPHSCYFLSYANYLNGIMWAGDGGRGFFKV